MNFSFEKIKIKFEKISFDWRSYSKSSEFWWKSLHWKSFRFLQFDIGIWTTNGSCVAATKNEEKFGWKWNFWEKRIYINFLKLPHSGFKYNCSKIYWKNRGNSHRLLHFHAWAAFQIKRFWENYSILKLCALCNYVS